MSAERIRNLCQELGLDVSYRFVGIADSLFLNGYAKNHYEVTVGGFTFPFYVPLDKRDINPYEAFDTLLGEVYSYENDYPAFDPDYHISQESFELIAKNAEAVRALLGDRYEDFLYEN